MLHGSTFMFKNNVDALINNPADKCMLCVITVKIRYGKHLRLKFYFELSNKPLSFC